MKKPNNSDYRGRPGAFQRDMTKWQAFETATSFARLMETAAFAGPVQGKDTAARTVAHHLANTGLYGGPPPTLDEARYAAKRAWGKDIPSEIYRALR